MKKTMRVLLGCFVLVGASVQAVDMVNGNFSSTNIAGVDYYLDEGYVDDGWVIYNTGEWSINATEERMERTPDESPNGGRYFGQIYTNTAQLSGILKFSFDYDVSCEDGDSLLRYSVVSYNEDSIGGDECIVLNHDTSPRNGGLPENLPAVNEIFNGLVYSGTGTASGTFTTNLTFSGTPHRIGIRIGGDEMRIDEGDHMYIDNVSLGELFVPATTFIIK